MQKLLKAESIPFKEGALSIVRMNTFIAIDDASLDGYLLNAADDTFLRSDVGIALWAEQDGSVERVEGRTQARLIQTEGGPLIEVSSEVDGRMKPHFRIRCVDVLGLGPISDVHGRINEYRDMLSEAYVHRVIH